MTATRVLYALQCGHAAPGVTTLVSGTLQCAWHRTNEIIIDVIEYEWRAKCKSCTYTRWAGLSKHNATIFARGHVKRQRGHTTIVEYTRHPDAVKTREKLISYNGRKSRT